MALMTVQQVAQYLVSKGLTRVTYRRVYGACMRRECKYTRIETRVHIPESELVFLEHWFREQDRMKEKEAAVGKYDLEGRAVLRSLGQRRAQSGDDARGQERTEGHAGLAAEAICLRCFERHEPRAEGPCPC